MRGARFGTPRVLGERGAAQRHLRATSPLGQLGSGVNFSEIPESKRARGRTASFPPSFHA